MENMSNFLVRRRRPFAIFLPAFALLLLISALGFTACKNEVRGENLQEELLSDPVFQEFATAMYQLRMLKIDGIAVNTKIQSLDPQKFSDQYERAATEAEKITVLKAHGYTGDLAQMVYLFAKGETTRDRFNEKYPNLGHEAFMQAIQTYEEQTLGKPDYTKLLKKRSNEK
jgi:hypothetical protein